MPARRPANCAPLDTEASISACLEVAEKTRIPFPDRRRRDLEKTPGRFISRTCTPCDQARVGGPSPPPQIRSMSGDARLENARALLDRRLILPGG